MFSELVYENFRIIAIPYAGANLELTQAIGMYEQDPNCSRTSLCQRSKPFP